LDNELANIDSEVIIVDNGSTDGCEAIAAIKNPVNLGISKGKNQGIEASNGEFILMLDGDVVPTPNSIILLLEYMEAHPEIEALGMYPDKWARSRSDYGYQEYCNILDPIEEHKTGIKQGWCCYYGMYRREIFDRGLRFDERFGPGYGWEDVDFAETMQSMGIKQWVCGINFKCGKYLHAINSSIRVMGYEQYMETSKNRSRIFSEKWKEPMVC
jgi:glycosyltransferase involved in cell wall biosynthesis